MNRYLIPCKLEEGAEGSDGEETGEGVGFGGVMDGTVGVDGT